MKQTLFEKLMVRFTALIIIILLVLSFSLTYLFEDYYFRTKEAEFFNLGQKIASIVVQTAATGDYVYLAAAMSQVERFLLFVEEKVWFTDTEGMIRAANTGEKWLGMQLKKEAINQVVQGKMVSMRGHVEFLGERVLMVAVPIMVQNTLTKTVQVEGAVFVYSPIAGISGTIQKFRQLLIILGLGVLAFAVVLSYQFSKSISHPLRKISSAAIEMAEGKYDVQVDITSEDEIGKLAANFNFLCKKLKDNLKMQQLFVANVSHELRTPLTSIRGFVKALRDGVYEDEESPTEYCNIVMDEVDRMNRLVTDLLDLSKIESGIMTFKMEACNLQELFKRTVASLDAILANGRYQIEVELPNKPLKAWADPDRIGQVLINLIRNAVKYSPPGSKILLRAERIGKMIKVLVADSGCGIPDEELEHIWNRFYKVDKARTRCEEDGTGLGLSIVKEIVERHGGQVSVESEVFKGSVFSFTLKSV